MKENCEIIRDLLPLYIDNICSEGSRKMVDDHLANCPECMNIKNKMSNNDIVVNLEEEKKEVLSRQSNFFKRKSAIAGTIIAGILFIPILACLIINIAVGGGMDWFFIVLASILVVASLIVVPLMVPTHKALWMLTISTASLILLYGVCCIVSHGSWFFIATTATLFGLCLAFLPAVVNSKTIKAKIGNNRALICIGADTLMFILMMISIGALSKNPYRFATTSFSIAMPLLVLVWGIFLLIRYPKCRFIIRLGMAFGFMAIWLTLLKLALSSYLGVPAISFGSLELTISFLTSMLDWILIFANAITAIVLIVIGLCTKGSKKK